MRERRIRSGLAALLALALVVTLAPAAAATDTGDPDHTGPTEQAVREPWDDGSDAVPLAPQPRARSIVTPPFFHLPFEYGQRWASGGPHTETGSGEIRASLDFSPQGANRRVVAVADGRVYRLRCSAGWYLGVDHGGGWRTEYYHLSGAREDLIGHWISAGTYLGEADNTIPCGGGSNGAHVHLSLLFGTGDRDYFPVDTVRFGTHIARQGAANHDGSWENLDGTTLFTNWGCCLQSTTPILSDIDPDGPFIRLAGVDRYATAAAISAATFSPGVPAVYLVAGDDFPDALAAAAVAGHSGSPVLLTDTDSLPAVTAEEIARLEPARVILLGGAQRVSSSVERAVAMRTSASITRVAGADRYDTAAQLSRATFPAGIPVVYVATGADFPDALSAAAAAGVQGGPVLLTPSNVLPDVVGKEIARLAPRHVIILGGESIVSEGVRTSIQALSPPVSRIAGSDRFETAAMVAAQFPAAPNSVIALTNGLAFPDALAGAVAATRAGARVLLTAPTSLPPATAAEITQRAPSQVVVFGGQGAVSAGVLRTVLTLLR